MADVEKYAILVLGSGEAGKSLAWTTAKKGHRTALVERRWLGGSCPNLACLPSKNLISSARVASLAKRDPEFGLEIGSLKIDMAGVQRRKRAMVEGLHQMHLARTTASGVELIMGEGRLIAPQTVEVALADGGKRRIFGERLFLVLGTRATIPEIPGLAEAQPMTHIEALNLDRLPEHLPRDWRRLRRTGTGTGNARFGARVTVIEAVSTASEPQKSRHRRGSSRIVPRRRN